MIQAVIFDFDGVIADSEPVHYRAFLQVMQPLGVTFDFEMYRQELIGFDDRDGVRYLLTEKLGVEQGPALSQQVAELCEAKQQAFNGIVRDQGMPPIAGALELIDDLVAHGVPIALATGATHADLAACFKPMGRSQLFQAVVTADDVARSKPDPQTYRQAFEALRDAVSRGGLSPQHCLAIEDTPTGLASARSASMRTLGLASTHDPEALHTAERVIAELTEVDWPTLQRWYND